MKIGQVGIYKGRKYKLLFIGHTKHGARAHLGFFDGSSGFTGFTATTPIKPTSPGRHVAGWHKAASKGSLQEK